MKTKYLCHLNIIINKSVIVAWLMCQHLQRPLTNDSYEDTVILNNDDNLMNNDVDKDA